MKTTVDELLKLGDAGATIINAGEHAGAREIAGAIRYRPHDLLEPQHLALPIAHDMPVILYDSHGRSDRLDEIARKLASDGFSDVRVLDATLHDWEGRGLPVQEPTIEQVVPPMRPSEVNDLDRRL